MATLSQSDRLKKELSLFDVYAIATGTTLSAGLFLLPGLAAADVGPAIVLSYMLAMIPLIPAILSVVELSTAMPRAGGAYYFLDRSLGPLAGTIGGLGTWLSLILKVAFALIGMGVYLALLLPAVDPTLAAVIFTLVFGAINMLGSKKTSGFQIALVVILLIVLAGFVAVGIPSIRTSNFAGFFDAGFDPILSTAGAVYISYAGITKVTSVSEEVKDPERNLPLGVFLALGTALVVYLLCTIVLVGVVPGETLAGNETPIAAAAEVFLGPAGVTVVSIAALLAFFSVSNAGILSASRYPLAMSRDRLIPSAFMRLNRRGTPTLSIVLTVGVTLLILIAIDPYKIAKLASAFQLLMFAIICLSVIVMRESRIESYDPSFKSPFYPWMQIIGIVLPFWLIGEMGWLAILFSALLVILGVIWFYFYASPKVVRQGAIYHVFERLGQRRFDALDQELRSILKEKGLRAHDPFDEIVARAAVIDASDRQDFEEVVELASDALAQELPVTATDLVQGFLQGTRTGATPVTGGVALPHLRLPGIERPALVLVRSREGLTVEVGDVYGETQRANRTHALFFLISPNDDAGRHLRMLAQLASRVDESNFLDEWNQAPTAHDLKLILLRNDRYVSINVDRDTPVEHWINKHIADLGLPQECLVAIIRRAGDPIVPKGRTLVREHDQLTIIGSRDAIRVLYARYVEPLQEQRPATDQAG